ncbi:MAG: hypothetical protein Q3998_07630 [Porphyromonas sp.]|nr:hypothetical protein [Porphyromonas sp.]
MHNEFNSESGELLFSYYKGIEDTEEDPTKSERHSIERRIYYSDSKAIWYTVRTTPLDPLTLKPLPNVPKKQHESTRVPSTLLKDDVQISSSFYETFNNIVNIEF